MNFYLKKLEMKLIVEFQSLWLAISHETDLFFTFGLLKCFFKHVF